MSIDKIAIMIASFFGIIATYWFFLVKKGKTIKASGSIDIIVEGGYTPEIISIPKGETTKLNFIRKDSNSCLEEVVLSDFKVRKHLPLNQKVTVEIKPETVGEFVYSCGMGMYQGKIIVK